MRSGIAFAGADVRAMQADDAANPGMLWVQRGGELWAAAAPGGAARRAIGDAPRVDARRRRALSGVRRIELATCVDLEARIDALPHAAPAARRRGRATSEDLLALTAYVAFNRAACRWP